MWLKIVYRLLKLIVRLLMVFIKMVSNVGDNENAYTFKVFKFVKVTPDKESKVPFPRSGHRIGADAANFYSFGGYNPIVPNSEEEEGNQWVNSLFQELWRFNFASRKWYRYPNSHALPLELASNALLLHRNILMVYGGTGSPFGFQCSNQLYLCRVNDPKGDMEEVPTSGELPMPLYGQALVLDNDYLYTIGGTTGLSYTCDIHRLNLKTKIWESVYIGSGQGEYEPKGRYRHEVAFDGKNIYMLGGGTANAAYDFLKIPVFNLEKRTWVKKKAIKDPVEGVPAARLCHGLVQVENEAGVKVYITGGHHGSGDGGSTVFDDLWQLDLETLRWTCISTCRLPVPLYFHSASITPEGKMCVFGGIFKNYLQDATRINTVYTVWLCIPKLSEMCWEAIEHYFPQINGCSRDKLIDLGLPRKYVQRLDGTDSEFVE